MTAKRFPGYSRPNYTMVPDELFDEQLPDLSGAELKALLYIIRRTFGFKKDSDNISLSQLLSGVVTRAGQRLDRGTGLSRSTLIAALKGLVGKNLIVTTQRASAKKGNEATNYRLNLLYHPSSKIELGESENRTRLVRKSDPQETDRQERDVNLRNSKGNFSERKRGQGEVLDQVVPAPYQTDNHQITLVHSDTSASGRPRGFKSIAHTLAQSHQIRGNQSPSLKMHPRTHDRTTTTCEQINACISEVSQDLNDWHHFQSNLTQALRLYAQSGLLEPIFVARLYEARAITKDRRKSLGSGPGFRPVAKPMAYFWSVVRDLLRLRDEGVEASTIPHLAEGLGRQGGKPTQSNTYLDGEDGFSAHPGGSGTHILDLFQTAKSQPMPVEGGNV